jgi:NADH-quinone oxidoreductase subunit M
MMNYLLSLTIWIPIIFGFIALALFSKNDCMAGYFSLLGAIGAIVFSAVVFYYFDHIQKSMQFEEVIEWTPGFNINYHLGVDGISMPFVMLNNLITVLLILAGFKVINHKVTLYSSMFLMMTGFISGSFCALDAILFYIFFEAMLILIYLIIVV